MDWTTLTRLEKEGRLPDGVDALPHVRQLCKLRRPPGYGIKILYLDIECSPNIADVWGMYDQNVGLSQLKSSSRIIGFSYRWNTNKARARWIGEDNHSREAMLKAVHHLCDEADVLVTYNGNSYDVKVLNAEWVKEGLTPPSPFQSIDLYTVVKKHFRFPSKKLAYVAQQLIGDTKVVNGGHELWNECLDPGTDPQVRRAAWQLMSKYCNQDVDLLVPLHDKLKPWLPETVNIALFDGHTHGCNRCGSTELVKRGFSQTAMRRYQRFQCKSCGGWTRGRVILSVFSNRKQ